MNWHDTRVRSPSSGRYDQYTVVYILAGEITPLGRAEWIPDDGYETGRWGSCFSTNGNEHAGCTVLYWAEHPAKPEIKP